MTIERLKPSLTRSRLYPAHGHRHTLMADSTTEYYIHKPLIQDRFARTLPACENLPNLESTTHSKRASRLRGQCSLCSNWAVRTVKIFARFRPPWHLSHYPMKENEAMPAFHNTHSQPCKQSPGGFKPSCCRLLQKWYQGYHIDRAARLLTLVPDQNYKFVQNQHDICFTRNEDFGCIHISVTPLCNLLFFYEHGVISLLK